MSARGREEPQDLAILCCLNRKLNPKQIQDLNSGISYGVQGPLVVAERTAPQRRFPLLF